MADDDVVVWYNPRCSKCIGAEELLAAHGIAARQVRYLDEPPAAEEIRQVLALLGSTDPRDMMRVDEPLYDELALATRSGEDLVDAMAAQPVLIQRPIVIRAGRAVIARPPERLLELLDDADD
jgi:arsenate reductase